MSTAPTIEWHYHRSGCTGCKKASNFMDARQLKPNETVSASRKLGRDDARSMLETSTRLLVAKGKKVSEWSVDGDFDDTIVDAMLGPTGNLRAPTLRVGTTLVVGFNESMYETVFGSVSL